MEWGQRTNEEWLQDLRGAGRDAALADLRRLLARGLRFALLNRPDVKDADIDDFVQDGLLRILAGLHTFRGESRFLTWAQKIVVRVAFSELRRRRWSDVSLDDVTAGSDDAEFVPDTLASPEDGPEKQAIQAYLLNTLRRMITEELTDRQREALTAALAHGMPLDVLAERLGTNRNALYKLLHDARQRLKKRMAAEGLSAQDFHEAFQ